MKIHAIILGKIFVISCTALALPPRPPQPSQTSEEICQVAGAKTAGAQVRIAWTDVVTRYDDVRVSYCVLRGDSDAKLAFERDAEIVYFAVSNVDKKADPHKYSFVVRTSSGRTLRQGPARLQPTGRNPQSCRVDVCQFFTEPGERVVDVSVESGELARRR